MRRAVVAAAVLLAASGCSGGDEAAATREVHVKLRFSRFVPDELEFPAGTTVRFVVDNRDPIDHEFLIGDEEVQEAHEEGTEPRHGAKPGEISVPAGETRTTTYTFEEPGVLLIGCHLPTHWDYGMRGEITVTG
ncbi:MAG TPA: cupredoxin domain-containing protein [Actinomycetota bacterium]|nr:cupredoxin domain-containing protein [Actinomycetota bacterium]